jgi:hypothetical protein
MANVNDHDAGTDEVAIGLGTARTAGERSPMEATIPLARTKMRCQGVAAT